MESPKDLTAKAQTLLTIAAQGDAQAYDELLAGATDRLLKLSRKMLRGYPNLKRWEQTDDVFQNMAIRLHRSLRTVKPDSVRGFFGLAALEIRRTLIDLIRHHFGPEGAAGKYHSDIKSKSEDGMLQNEPDRRDDADSLETWSLFHETVEKLPDEERDVMHLVWYVGMKQAEVADVLDISVPTVKRRWYRARLRLYTLLDGQIPLLGKPD